MRMTDAAATTTETAEKMRIAALATTGSAWAWTIERSDSGG
jgi:hypothetical protein